MTMRENKHKGPMELGTSEGQSAASHNDGALTETLGMKIQDTRDEATAKQSIRPLVSVIIPTYNRSWALEKAVRSVFDQEYRPIECLIVDDGSTDDTADIVKHLIHECPEDIDVRYFVKENSSCFFI